SRPADPLRRPFFMRGTPLAYSVPDAGTELPPHSKERRMRRTTSRFGRFLATIGACLALLSATPAAIAQVSDVSIEELTRLQGQGSDEWWGLGLVIGLPNTGDSPD